MAQYAHLAAMDADLAAAVARFPPPPNVVDIAEARKQTEATVGMLKQMLTPQLPAGIEESTLLFAELTCLWLRI